LYIGGIPANFNGTPSTTGVTTGTGTGAPTEGTIAMYYSANGTTGGIKGSAMTTGSIVVIVNDATVSKVEYARSTGANNTTIGDWRELTKTKSTGSSYTHSIPSVNAATVPDAKTPADLDGKRYVRKLAEDNTQDQFRYYVRITAEDGVTTRVYRWNMRMSAGTPTYAYLNSLTITPEEGEAKTFDGIASGWWNHTAAPDLKIGTVTLPAGKNTVSITATWGGNPTFDYIVIPSGNTTEVTIDSVPTTVLLEGAYTWGTATTGNPTGITGLNNGDVIVLRAWYASSNNYVIHNTALIKVIIPQE